ncbi:hypothetical protein M3231_14840 [Neobacillus mesonae]|nr:hypothetical protein [Neobacillus mesonae]
MRQLQIRFIITVICSMAMIQISGCGMFDQQSDPEETFRRALTGIAGKEEMSFEGQAGLRTSSKGEFEQQFYYKGTLSDHNQLVVSSRERNKGFQVKKQTGDASRPISMERKAGSWRMLEKEGSSSGASSRLNPVEQLERIGRMEGKRISNESGSPRGTQMIRIELDSAEAKTWMADQLNMEMEQLHNGLPDLANQVNKKDRDKCLKELEQAWKAGNDKLNQRIQGVQAAAVYHLMVDKKTSLPIRLSSESRVSDPNNPKEQELLITEVYFSKYK